ncbi:transposase [Streptomyces sp. NPDC051976]|uniref:transposase n=1 Tax=Streptomyces sp. NPDC051976 TaxID=3154947 RepID=UPI00343DCC4C
MESMGKEKPPPRRSFMPELKAEIVELCRCGDRSVGQVAKDFDLVRDWLKQVEADAGERDGLTSSEREERAALRRENRRLREDVDILKRVRDTGCLVVPQWQDRRGWLVSLLPHLRWLVLRYAAPPACVSPRSGLTRACQPSPIEACPRAGP